MPRTMYCMLQCTCNSSITLPNLRGGFRQGWENGLVSIFSMCTLSHRMKLQWAWEESAWRFAVQVLLVFPPIGLCIWVLVGLAGCYGLRQPLWLLGSAPKEADTIAAIDQHTDSLRSKMSRTARAARGCNEPTDVPREKVAHHLEFALFVADYVSDWNCLVQFARSWQIGLAIAQGIIIVMPIALDCYRGKIQKLGRTLEFGY